MLSRRRATVLAVAVSAALLPVSAAGAATGSAATSGTADRATTDAFGRIADAVLTDRTAALLDRQQLKSTAAKIKGGVRLSSALTKTEGTALSALRGRQSRLAALGEAYTAADTRVGVDKTRIKGSRATVEVTETTVLTYKKIRGDEPRTTGFKAHHELTFVAQADGTWKLSGLRSTDKGPRAVNEPVTTAPAKVRPSAVIDAPRAATTYPAPANPKQTTGTGYDYTAMAAYAEKYWKNYNTAYRKFNGVGGDCTNFVSQSLLAGKWQPISTVTPEEYDTWYYVANGQSDSWAGVNEWSWFTQTAKRTTPLANVYQLDVGDVLQMDFDKDGSKDHTMITSYRGSNGVPYLTYHDADTYRRSLSSLIASYPTAAFYGYRT
ncbi:amidase domain-containing protein [Streptomyces avermitilis]|uniref:amidase domain-containing protein n=1 Tax=Streptomyces sp. SID5469 TaxID=2690296 RepID=UPI001F5B3657|nr:amidase domain-containing protein [Streptomyces avermitilis]